MSRAALPWLLARWAGGLARARPWRAAVQVVAIAAGVALGYAVNLINGSALRELSAAEHSLSGAADLSVVGPPGGFDEDWYRRIAADPAVAMAAPLLEVDATLADAGARGRGPGRGQALQIVGLDVLRSASIEPDLVGVLAAAPGRDRLARLIGPGLFVSPAGLAQLHAAPGDTVELAVGTRRVGLTIAGSLPAARDAIGAMDLGFAQWRLDRLGRLTRIDVRLVAGADAQAVVRGWRLAPTLRAERPGAAVGRSEVVSRAYRINLDVLSVVALFTGGFLVFSLQSQAIVVRRPQLALLRMLGATRGQIAGLLLAEAGVYGIAGALLGLALGAALASAGLHALGGDLGGGYFRGIRPQIALDAPTSAVFFALGLAAALAGAWLPAREAARAPPAPALKAGAEPAPGTQRPHAWWALAAFALAAALLAAPPLDGIPVAAYAAIGLLLVATIALKPLLAPWLFAPLARWVSAHARRARDAPAWLAATRLARLPRFAAVGAAGIVASFALMVAMATMVSSFRGSLDSWLERMLPADLYVRAAPAGASGYFSARDVQRLRADPQVERLVLSRSLPLALDPARPPVVLLARQVDREHAQDSLPLVGAALRVAAPDVPVWVSEAVAALYGARPGARLRLPIGPEGAQVTVAGVWRDYARQAGSIVIDGADYERLTGDATRTDAALWLRPGASAAAVAQRLVGQLEAPALQVAEAAQIRALSLHVFDRSFRVTYLLEWAAIAIGLLGLAATFSAQAAARLREFGMLRHLGVTRRQVLGVLAGEAALVTLLAAALGASAGLGIAWILVAVVNPQSFHWSMDLRVPWALLGALAGGLLVAAAGSATLAGRGALSTDAVRAVKDDW